MASDSLVTSRILVIYSLGILPNALSTVLLRCLFAIEDMVTPLVAELFDLGFFIVSALFLARHFGLEGLVVARCMSFFVVMAILAAVLARKKLLRFDGELLRLSIFTSLATLAMGAVSWGSMRLFQPVFETGSTLLRLVLVCTGLALSAGTFLTAARLLRLSQARQILSTAREMLPGAGNRGME
jgi:peptidoglycan biosynthesis protein MviN/MurJ (putative lipid II flippase)